MCKSGRNPQRNATLHTLYFWRRLCILAAHFTSAVPESTKSLIRACLLPRPASPPPAVLEGGQTKASSCPTSDVTCNGPAPDKAPQLRQACLDISYGSQSEERNVYKIIIRIGAQLLIQVLHIWFLPLPCVTAAQLLYRKWHGSKRYLLLKMNIT